MSKKRGVELYGNIIEVRQVEDAIRETKKYTEGIFTMHREHPIQGADFPSKVLSKYYEVYPDLEISWDMPAGVAFDWLWGEYVCIDVYFKYDYRNNNGYIRIKDGSRGVALLINSIPKFEYAIKSLKNGMAEKSNK